MFKRLIKSRRLLATVIVDIVALTVSLTWLFSHSDHDTSVHMFMMLACVTCITACSAHLVSVTVDLLMSDGWNMHVHRMDGAFLFDKRRPPTVVSPVSSPGSTCKCLSDIKYKLLYIPTNKCLQPNCVNYYKGFPNTEYKEEYDYYNSSGVLEKMVDLKAKQKVRGLSEQELITI